MKRFRFRLESLMSARKMNEQEALRRLAEAQRKLQSEVDSKKDLENQLEQALNQRTDLGTVPSPASAFQFIQLFIIGTKQKIIRADQAIFRANRVVDKALAAYLQARRLTKMMEKMKDQAFSEFKFEQRKMEQKQQDDLAVMRRRLTLADEEDLSS